MLKMEPMTLSPIRKPLTWRGEQRSDVFVSGCVRRWVTGKVKQTSFDLILPCIVCPRVPIRHGRERRGPAGRGRTPPPGQRTPNSPQTHFLRRKGSIYSSLIVHFIRIPIGRYAKQQPPRRAARFIKQTHIVLFNNAGSFQWCSSVFGWQTFNELICCAHKNDCSHAL